jgi:hypothetical protein
MPRTVLSLGEMCGERVRGSGGERGRMGEKGASNELPYPLIAGCIFIPHTPSRMSVR